VRGRIFLVVVLVVWGLITHGTFAGSGDEPHYLIAAHSIAFDGDLDLANNYADATLIGGGSLEPEAHARAGAGGVLRPAHDVGLPLLAAPYVRLAYPLAAFLGRTVPAPLLQRARLDAALIFRHLISLAVAVVTALLAIQLFEILGRVAPPGAAARWALLVVLSPPLLSHAFLFFTEIPSALLLVWAFRTLSEPGGRVPRWTAVGGVTGLLLLIHVRNIAVVIGLALWAIGGLVRARAGWRAWAAWTAGLAVPLVVRTAIVHAFWGGLLTTPLATAGDLGMPPGDAVREAAVRVSGLLLDQEFGLLPYAPLYLLFPAGLLAARRAGMPGTTAAVALASAYLASIVVPYVNVHGWSGGWAPAARMITPVVPLLALFAVAGARAASGAGRAFVTVIVVLQVAFDAVVWQWP
jgi:hypothetical protein